jgi:protein tyrosine/serine phosphatase
MSEPMSAEEGRSREAPVPGRRAWLDMIFNDHGIFRLIYRNHFRVGRDMYRSNQPFPYQIRQANRAGMRTVVNLRGASHKGYYLLERQACAECGIDLVDFLVRSRDLPSAESLHEAAALFKRIRYPALMHCKSGADRAGFMSALYLLVHEGRPAEEAQRQLHWFYGHYRQSKTGVLDHFFDAFRAHHQTTGEDFYTWVDTVYDPEALAREFHSERWANLLVDRVLRRE